MMRKLFFVNMNFLVLICFYFLCAAVSADAYKNRLQAFEKNRSLKAEIIRTDFGVPHIRARSLESLAFGVGYAFAEDNICILSDQIVKVNSERSKYFGPDSSVGSGDSKNLISDFGYKALKIRKHAENSIHRTSRNTQAMLQGYAAGFNKYLQKKGKKNIDPACASQPWVREIDSIDMLTYLLSLALFASGERFLNVAFFANPEDEFQPIPISEKMLNRELSPDRLKSNLEDNMILDMSPITNKGAGSNAWALGRNKTENGRGALLANPHFPHTGNLRFWQSHLTIPGVLDVMGGSLHGIPGPINVGFNQNLAWTHTLSTAEHFIVYKLELDPFDPARYIFDGKSIPLKKEKFTIDVLVSPGDTQKFSKEYYYSRFGLMIETPLGRGPFPWNDITAFTYKDANELNLDIVDHWLSINLATNLEQFQEAFKNYNGVLYNNTVYADKHGNAFYIDNSNVPFLSDEINSMLKSDSEIIATRNIFGFHILPGNEKKFDFISNVTPYEYVPKFLSKEYVQNSNDSFWASNLEEPLEGYSRLFGSEFTELSLRTRMSLKMLTDSAGEDELFDLNEVESALLSNRVLLGELILDDLIKRCSERGTEPVRLDNGDLVDISDGCLALSQWNGKMDSDSIGALVLREFSYQFNTQSLLQIPFNPHDPANTPNTLISSVAETKEDPVLKSLALAIANINHANLSVFSELGQVQFVQKSNPDGSPRNNILPWPGSFNQEGGFNTFATSTQDNGTLLPRHTYSPSTDVVSGNALVSGLSPEGYHINFGSSWMFVVNFERHGPVARGLLTYSQSTNINSPWFEDQSYLYSNQKTLRPLYFKRRDIYKNIISYQFIKKRKRKLKN